MSYGEPTSQRELSESKEYARSRLAMKRAEERSATKPTYQNAHGGAAVQAARIIAGVAAERRPTVAAQQCGDIVDTLDAIELIARNCMGQAGMKSIYDLVRYAKSRIT